jgi:hypothetical protein
MRLSTIARIGIILSAASVAIGMAMPLGEIRGVIELTPHGPAAMGEVRIDRSRRIGRSDSMGRFSLDPLDPGLYDLTVLVTVQGTNEKLVKHLTGVEASGAVVTQITVTMVAPIAVAGRVGGINVDNCGNFLVVLPEFDLAAPLSPTGSFVINGVPPGRHRLELRLFSNPRNPVASPKHAIEIDVFTTGMNLLTGLEVPTGPADIQTDPETEPVRNR